MKSVWLYTHDPILTMFYTFDEAKDLFGVELETDEYLTAIPSDLHDRFLKAKTEFYALSNELEKYRK